MGVAADHCPHCDRVAPCAIACRVDGAFLFLLPLISNTTETNCRCGLCNAEFSVEQGRYRGFVSAAKAAALPIETLVARTNPAAVQYLDWSERRHQFADDSQFTTIATVVEQLGPGRLRTQFLQNLEQWDQLTDVRRLELITRAVDLDRVLRYLRTVPTPSTGSAGCLAGTLMCLLVWAIFLGLCAADYRFLGGATGFVGLLSGFVLGSGVVYWQQRQRIHRWAREVVLPEGEKAGIDFTLLAEVLKDLPAARNNEPDDFGRLREHAATVLRTLMASGKIRRQADGEVNR